MINLLIRFLHLFVRPIEGNPDEWLERERILMGEKWREFNCGSVRGIYRCENKEFQILAVENTKKNNHFTKVLEWFEKSCRRDNYKLAFLEVENPRLKEKLQKLGFTGDTKKMIKSF